MKVYYQRPNYTHAVPGDRTVGLTGEGESYCCEASPDSPSFRNSGTPVGYGTGDTPQAARRSAYTALTRLLRPKGGA